jgi:hypothetical protein
LDSLFSCWLIELLLKGVRLFQSCDILLAENLLLDVIPLRLGLLVFLVETEHVEVLLSLHFLLDIKLVGDLIFTLYQVELGYHSRMLLEPRLSNGKQILYAILSFLIYLRFMKKTFESLENSVCSCRCNF